MIVIRFIHFTQHNDIVDVSVNVIDVDQTPTMKTLCLRRQKAIKFIDTKYIHRQWMCAVHAQFAVRSSEFAYAICVLAVSVDPSNIS